MRAARRGDEAAYRAFLADASAWLRGYARAGLNRAGRSTGDAEDIVQETLIALHLRRHTWDEAQGVGPWLRGIARHKLIDALRRRGSHGHVPVDDLAEVLPAPAPEAALPEGDILRMAAALPEKQAAIIQATFVEGQRAAEIGSRLGMSEGAVRVALHRALKALAAKFGDR